MSGRDNIQRGGGRGREGQGGAAASTAGGRGRGTARGNSPMGRGRGSNSPASSEGSFRGGGRGGQDRGRASFGGGGGFRGSPRGRGGSSAPLLFATNSPAVIDERLSGADQLVASFRKLAVKTELPLRPGYGTLGRRITLRANFFPVKLPKQPFYDYNVEITPKTDINRLKKRIFFLLEQSLPHAGYIAHDRSMRLVSARELPQPLEIQVPFYEDGESGPRPGATVYTVSIAYFRDLNFGELTNYLDGRIESRNYDPLPLISALNLVLQQQPADTGVRVGKNRYFFPLSGMPTMDLGLGVEACQGFFTSVRPTYKQLMVNVNVCMTAFYTPGNLAQAIIAFSRSSLGAMPRRFSQGIKVTTTHLGYKMKKPLKRITDKPASQTFFEHDKYGRVSVEQYFKREYNIKLQHPHDVPVVDISGKNSKRPNYLPAELCEIEAGQPYFGKLDSKETANMIRYACNPPGVNADAIVNRGLPILGLAPQSLSSTIDGFDMSISTEMAVIPARELPAPRLTYKAGSANVRDGSWNILNVKFHRGATLANWWVLVVRDGPASIINDPNDQRLVDLCRGFSEKCRASGMTFPNAPPQVLAAQLLPPSSDPNRTGSINKIRQAIMKKLDSERGRKPSFILVLLSRVDNYIYPGIKRLGDVELGIHTVHMLLEKALKDPKKQDQYFSNVALKLNTKLGGINHMLDNESMKWLTSKKTMVVGMDVTHPGPSSVPGTPSIAAVVASVDDKFVQFPASMRLQQSKTEMIQELKQMMVERLTIFQKQSRCLPDRVFVYRDGVSEGEFDTVIHEELPQIIDSFKKFNTKEKLAPYRPKLTIIICGKRHHARFFPTNVENADRNGNTRPGTVVDQGITEIYGFDFYLQAHAGLQGTVRPTHYTVVYDENRLGADELQQGTHHASYLYARATKAVSLVPAAYYSDLACERGRAYINDLLNAFDDKTSSAGTGKGKPDKEEEAERVFRAAEAAWGEGLHVDLKDSMFYI